MKTLSWLDVEQPRPLIIAHRGARLEAPENTLPAFERAHQLGADGIEFDVRLTADGTPVIMHDPTCDRTTDSTGPVIRKTYAELRQMEVVAGREQGHDRINVPTLEEVLEVWQDKMLINIELKQPSISGQLAQTVAQMLVQIPREGIVVSSFNPAALWHLNRALPDAQLAFLFIQPQRFIARLLCRTVIPCAALHPQHTATDAKLVRRAHEHGQFVHVWTVNSADRMNELAQIEVDAIITDDPALARKTLREKGT